MNAKAKGARIERRARDYMLNQQKALAVIKAGGSFGVFDLIALGKCYVTLVQVKTNRWPGQAEMRRIRDFPNLPYATKLILRFNDGQKHPQIRVM